MVKITISFLIIICCFKQNCKYYILGFAVLQLLFMRILNEVLYLYIPLTILLLFCFWKYYKSTFLTFKVAFLILLRLFTDIYLLKIPLWNDDYFGSFIQFSYLIGIFLALMVIIKSF